MSSLVALSISIGVLGAVATWLALGPLSSFILIWAVFVGWATYFATGGNSDALKNTIVCGVFGAICAWVAAVIILGVNLADTLSLPVWAAIVVGVTVLILCLAAHISALSTIPASVYGYACTFAFLLQTPDKLSMDALTGANFNNALLIISVSLITGAIFGALSGKLGGVLSKEG